MVKTEDCGSTSDPGDSKRPQHFALDEPSVDTKESGIHDETKKPKAKMNSVLTRSQASLTGLAASNLEASCSHESFSQTISSSEPTTADPESPQPPSLPHASSSSGVISPEMHVPLKATNFGHLRQKYLHELEYMLTEFKKLERQLLGAKVAARESDGSRERREKLHSFIQHLEDTIQQIHTGCQLEAEGKPTVKDASDDGSALSKPTLEKREEENVQKLEEHILANLLPVKVRLKKQLAAQQGAKHNPAGMPVVRGVPNDRGQATFAPEDAAARRRSLESTSSQFGKPLAGGGSSLTQKLHGQTLGDANRVRGHGVGSNIEPSESKILFAGMAIGSDQVESGVNAATSAHEIFVSETLNKEDDLEEDDAVEEDQTSFPQPTIEASFLSEEHRRRLKRKKRKRKKQREELILQQEQEQEAKQQSAKRPKSKGAAVAKKRGPRSVEYMCAFCNEVYSSTCDYNPWWSLSQHECPKCRKVQIPRLDISAPANAIEYHPALLAHAEENGEGGGNGGVAMHMPPAHLNATFPATSVGRESDSDSFGSDLSDEDWDDLVSEDNSESDSDGDALVSMTPAEQAEKERFGAEYIGPKLSEADSAKLLTLMAHASTCPCDHKSSKHREVCRSTKWMMLHVRDCPGTTSTFDVCPFPWCRKVKHLLYHLVSCEHPDSCEICGNKNLNSNLSRLQGLNTHRLKKHRASLLAKCKVASSGRKGAASKPRSAAARASTGKPARTAAKPHGKPTTTAKQAAKPTETSTGPEVKVSVKIEQDDSQKPKEEEQGNVRIKQEEGVTSGACDESIPALANDDADGGLKVKKEPEQENEKQRSATGDAFTDDPIKEQTNKPLSVK